jgi:hypothetical protein
MHFNIQALENSDNQKIISESLEIAPHLPFKQFSLPESKLDSLQYKLMNSCL